MSGQERFIFRADKMVQRAVTSVKMWKEELRRTNVNNELKNRRRKREITIFRDHLDGVVLAHTVG